MPWDEFVTSYKREIDTDGGRQAMDNIRCRIESSNVILLCYEPDGAHYHHLLYYMILDRLRLHAAFKPQYIDHYE